MNTSTSKSFSKTLSTISLSLLVMSLSGCANTLTGLKADTNHLWTMTKQKTSDVYHSTKNAIHQATSDDPNDLDHLIAQLNAKLKGTKLSLVKKSK